MDTHWETESQGLIPATAGVAFFSSSIVRAIVASVATFAAHAPGAQGQRGTRQETNLLATWVRRERTWAPRVTRSREAPFEAKLLISA